VTGITFVERQHAPFPISSTAPSHRAPLAWRGWCAAALIGGVISAVHHPKSSRTAWRQRWRRRRADGGEGERDRDVGVAASYMGRRACGPCQHWTPGSWRCWFWPSRSSRHTRVGSHPCMAGCGASACARIRTLSSGLLSSRASPRAFPPTSWWVFSSTLSSGPYPCSWSALQMNAAT